MERYGFHTTGGCKFNHRYLTVLSPWRVMRDKEKGCNRCALHNLISLVLLSCARGSNERRVKMSLKRDVKYYNQMGFLRKKQIISDFNQRVVFI